MAISTGSFAKLLWPGLNKVYGDAYKEHDMEWPKIFETFNSTKNYEEDLLYTGFGQLVVKPEGEAITYDTAEQGWVSRYVHDVRALGFIITREMYEDDLYGVIGGKKARALGFSARQTEETVGANILNRAFNSSYTGGDGLELCSTAHVFKTGGTWQNELTTAADLSEASLEQALINIGQWTDDRGLKINASVKRMIVPVNLEFDACRLLKTQKQVDTANNNISAIYSLGSVPEGHYVNHYLTDTDAWFLITDVADGLKKFVRRKTEFTTDNDWDTENAKFKVTQRYKYGWTDPRGIFASPGA